MKIKNLIKSTSILSYCLIILNGSMIALPFIFYLIFSSVCIFKLESINQSISSIIGIIGLILIIKNFEENSLKSILINFISFLMLLVPIIERLYSISLKSFDYLGFQIPFTLFLSLFLISLLISIIYSLKNYLNLKN